MLQCEESIRPDPEEMQEHYCTYCRKSGGCVVGEAEIHCSTVDSSKMKHEDTTFYPLELLHESNLVTLYLSK